MTKQELGRANVKRSQKPQTALSISRKPLPELETRRKRNSTTYLGCAILRRALRLRELAFSALAPVAIVVAAISAGAAAHHVEGVVGVRRSSNGGIDIVRACGAGGHVVVAMGEVLLRRLEVLHLVWVVWSVNDGCELGS